MLTQLRRLWWRLFPPTVESVARKMRSLGKEARYILKETTLEKKKLRLVLGNGSDYEAELVQVAASAIAALTDYRMERNMRLDQETVEAETFNLILAERQRQDELLERSLPANLDLLIWGMVLIEETAQVLDEIEF